jgi:hypothetical protein
MRKNDKTQVKFVIISLALFTLLAISIYYNLRNQRTANELCIKQYARNKPSQSGAISRNAPTQDNLLEAFTACIY